MSAVRAALAALSAVVLTAACAAGQKAETALEKPTLDGTEGHVGEMSLVNVSLQSPAGSSYARGADVAMTVYIANAGDSDEKLTNVSSPAFTGWSIVPTSSLTNTASATPLPATSTSPASSAAPAQPVTIKADSAVGLGLSNIGTGNGTSRRTLVLHGLAGSDAPLTPGMAVKVTFTFDKAGQATLTVPVHLSSEPYSQTLPGTASPEG